MAQKNFNTIAGAIFLVVGLFHIWRAISQTTLWINSTGIPFWISWVAGIVALILAYYGIKHGRKGK